VPMLRGLEDAALLSTRLARRLDSNVPAFLGRDASASAAPRATAA
jgi:hypothetical protein